MTNGKIPNSEIFKCHMFLPEKKKEKSSEKNTVLRILVFNEEMKFTGLFYVGDISRRVIGEKYKYVEVLPW